MVSLTMFRFETLNVLVHDCGYQAAIADCKSAYAGSIPTQASIIATVSGFGAAPRFQPRSAIDRIMSPCGRSTLLARRCD